MLQLFLRLNKIKPNVKQVGLLRFTSSKEGKEWYIAAMVQNILSFIYFYFTPPLIESVHGDI